MKAVTFDTLKYANSLKKVGVSPQQAERMAELQKDAINELTENSLAKKEDVNTLKHELKMEINELKGDMKLIKWSLGVILGGTIIIKLLF